MDVLNQAFKAHGDLKSMFFDLLTPAATLNARAVANMMRANKAEEFVKVFNDTQHYTIQRISLLDAFKLHLPYHVNMCHRAVPVANSKFERWYYSVTFFHPHVYNGSTPDWLASNALHFDFMLHRPWAEQIFREYAGEELDENHPWVVADMIANS